MYRIYRNLHKRNWTVQHKTEKGWRKLDGYKTLTAPEAAFTISEKGRDRVRREGKKYVHAYAEVPSFQPISIHTADPLHWTISYNPYNDLGFSAKVDEEGMITANNLYYADNCVFAADGKIYAQYIYNN